MTSNFTLNNNKIILKNGGEFFGSTLDFEYNIGDKLYEFAIMSYEDFDKLKAMYTQLIEVILHEFTENIKECMDYITIIWITLQKKNLKNGYHFTFI